MPLYEYECSRCGRREEVLQRVGAPPIEACSECGGEMQRLLSAPAFQFKGSGWYVTDYARKSASPSGESKSEAGDGKAAGKESAKPAKSSSSKKQDD